MKSVSLAFVAVLLGSNFAGAADMPDMVPPPMPIAPWSWTGLYIGGHVGGGFGRSQFSDPAGPAIYGGSVRSPMGLGGGQVGYNFQVPNSNFLVGIEADASLSSADGTATCLASSGFFISANCRVRQDSTGSLTGRAGWVTGAQGRTLIYAKGGAAWLQERVDITTNALLPAMATSFDGVRWGWTVGAGVEKALTPAWSFRLEYDYANFGALSAATPASYFQIFPPFNAYVATPGGTSQVSQNLQTVKLGLNYRIGVDGDARWQPAASDYNLRGATDTGVVPGVEVEIGGRTWYSSGRFQKDLGRTSVQSLQNVLVSRLTYDTTAASGELFGRLDTPYNVYLKGFIGGGKLLSGKMNDEDWVIAGATVPYSNTLSDPVTGNIGYATLDVGYSLFRGASANVGAFVGWNYFREDKSAYGCVQIANSNAGCVPSIPSSTLGITENTKWNSLRVGANGVVKLVDGLTLTAEAAYLPAAWFTGTDNHLLRTDVADTVSPESGTGHGMQLEAILSYAIGKSFSVGAGGRYWAMWANGATTNIFGTPCPCQTLPVRTERYGGFLQASYKFDGLN
jgi:opacity protein-like surface antigen